VLTVVADAQRTKRKVLCFVTGIPGAGKTLAGLNVVHSREVSAKGGPASVFMSGNGPLVNILREALALDSAARNREAKNIARRKVGTFVQNIHHFVHDNLDRHDSQPPYEHAIVFDEARRAWNALRGAPLQSSSLAGYFRLNWSNLCTRVQDLDSASVKACAGITIGRLSRRSGN